MIRRLDEDQLGTWLAGATGPLLRHETATSYDVPTDGSDYGRYLAGEAAPSPEVGAAWRDFVRPRDVHRVRVLHDEPSRFVCFESEWQYSANVRAGERIHVLDVRLDGPARTDHELWVTEDSGVAVMHYNPGGSFSHADLVDDDNLRRQAWEDYHAGVSFSLWWHQNPQYHRAAWLDVPAAVGG